HISAYDRIFDRCGLEWHRVSSDVGMMGGAVADEYMAPCPAGEDRIALADGYAANVEVAVSRARAVELPAPAASPTEVETPGSTTVEDVAGTLGVAQGALLKAVPVMTEGRGLLMALVRGDDALNELKLSNFIGESVRQASPEEIDSAIGPTGFIGPIGADCPVICDLAINGDSYVCGANEVDRHLMGVDPARDFQAERADIRAVRSGDLTESGLEIEIVPAIEVGNIFKLGTRYSEALGATFLDESGIEHPIVMGSYGIGPARIIAASVEQRADDRGIAWPRSLSPWDMSLVPLSKEGEPERGSADDLYESLSDAGVEVLYDDRDANAGEKLTDAELIGCPLRVVVGKRSLAEGNLEVQIRKTGADETLGLDGATDAISDLLDAFD
ncbi:MAG: proline--tRNA ligase, partial [bacterium]